MRLVESGGARRGRYVQAGDLGAMGLIHELFHVAIGRARQGAGGGPLAVALRDLQASVPDGRLDRARANAGTARRRWTEVWRG